MKNWRNVYSTHWSSKYRSEIQDWRVVVDGVMTTLFAAYNAEQSKNGLRFCITIFALN